MSAVGDFEKIWREHCEDERTLSEYALAMKNLADHHWANKCEGEGRIEWCRRYGSRPVRETPWTNAKRQDSVKG